MKRLVLIVGALTMCTSMCTACLWACVILDLKKQPRYEYRYTDLNGVKGTSKACFEREGVNVCVIGKHTRKVLKTEKYEVVRRDV